MRSASRVFYSIAAFAIFAAALFTIGTGFEQHEQGIAILTSFAIASAYLGYLLGRQVSTDLIGLHLPDEGEHHDEPIHLPPPSWMPAAYSVAAGVLFLGLIFNYTIAWVGLALLVITTIGWARESVVEYRREVAHHKKPAYVPDRHTVDVAHLLAGFRAAHGGAEAVVQHIGRGSGEIVAVGGDGAWGTFEVQDVGRGREAVGLAGVTLHETWPSQLASRVLPDRDLWVRMGNSNPFHAPKVRHPRDGSTQVGAYVFLSIAVFAYIAAALFWSGQRGWDAAQGTGILTCFAIANTYLYVALRNAKAGPKDAAFVDDHYVTREPVQPPVMDPATLHLPGPSWMPAFYSVAAAVIVIGLITNYAILWVGLVLLVLTTIGWGVESVREYRATLAHGGHGASADALHGSADLFKH